MTDTNTAPVYQPDFARQAEHLCRLGAETGELAAALQVDEATISRWLDQHAAFTQAVARGRAHADAAVTTALFRRACGFEQRLTKWLREDGKMVARPYSREVLPDRQACIFWLQHRRPDLWGPPGARRASDASCVAKEQDARLESRAPSKPAESHAGEASSGNEAQDAGQLGRAADALMLNPTLTPDETLAASRSSDASCSGHDQDARQESRAPSTLAPAPLTPARSRQQQKWKRKQKRADA
ncbi:MAG TPA: hypothetical protein VJ890_08655, partial [Vineibacter sp.]|nr:hypothetical protein [Vineibacter sp.]